MDQSSGTSSYYRQQTSLAAFCFWVAAVAGAGAVAVAVSAVAVSAVAVSAVAVSAVAVAVVVAVVVNAMSGRCLLLCYLP